MDEIILVPYDSDWPRRFAEEADRVRAVLPPGMAARVEHFGSTAIPGLDAKPIIDLLVGVPDLATAREETVPRLERLGYAFWYDNPDTSRLFFVKGLPPNGPRSHHIHIIALDSPL